MYLKEVCGEEGSGGKSFANLSVALSLFFDLFSRVLRDCVCVSVCLKIFFCTFIEDTNLRFFVLFASPLSHS